MIAKYSVILETGSDILPGVWMELYKVQEHMDCRRIARNVRKQYNKRK